MKKIIYTRSDGGVSVVSPAEGQRLATKVLAAFGIVLFQVGTPLPVEQISRIWKILFGVEWAETEDEFVTRIAAKDVPTGTPFQIVEQSAIPQDRAFHNAWKQAGATIEHDLPRAVIIAQDKIRQARVPRFAHWDAQWNKAQEDSDLLALERIKQNRQKLRDAPADSRLWAAMNEAELKTAMQAVISELP